MVVLKLILTFAFITLVFAKRPNIVLIVADDLGWGDVSFHGSRQIATPNIDALASDGIILNNFYVSTLCSPTRGALLTGRHAVQLGLQEYVIECGQPYGLPLSVSTLPQWLQRLNYSTVGVGKWHLGFHRKSFIPTERGFDHFFGYWNGHTDYWNRSTTSLVITNETGKGIDWHRDAEDESVAKYKGQYSTDLFTDKAVDAILKQDKDKPLFLYLAHQAVHWANLDDDGLQSPNKYINRYQHIKNMQRRTLAGMMSALDDSVARVMLGLEKAGKLNNTIVVFTTDNGGSTARIENRGIWSNLPLRGSKGGQWEGGVRATAFVWSKLLPKKYVSDQLMHVTDLPVTLFKAAGGDVHDLGRLEGVDFWETLKKNSSSPRKHLLHNIWKTWAVRSGKYKLKSIEDKTNKMYEPFGFNDTVDYRNTTDWSPDAVKSPVGKLLEKLNGNKIKPVKVVVECGKTKKGNCKAPKKVCLFDIEQDPCEFNDISEQKPELVKQLTELMLKYNATAVPSAKVPLDYRGLPAYNNGRWSVWLK